MWVGQKEGQLEFQDSEKLIILLESNGPTLLVLRRFNMEEHHAMQKPEISVLLLSYRKMFVIEYTAFNILFVI